MKEKIGTGPPANGEKETWRERAEKLYDRLEGKIRFITEIRNFLKNESNLKLNPQDFEQECGQRMKELKNSFDALTKEKYKKLADLKAEKEAITDLIRSRREKMGIRQEVEDENLDFDEALERGMEEHDKEEGDEELQRLFEREEKTEEKIDKLLKDDNVFFLDVVDTFFSKIIQKRKETFLAEEQYHNEPEKFWGNVYRSTGFDLKKADKKDIEVLFAGCGVNIILRKEDFKQLAKQRGAIEPVCGFHCSDTVYNFIEDRPGKETTINHENSHNLSESFSGSILYGKDLLESTKKRIELVKTLKGMGVAPPIIIEESITSIKRNIHQYTKFLFGELIADIEQPPKENVRDFVIYLLGAVDKIERLKNETEDLEIKDILHNSLEKLKDRSVNLLNKLSDIFYIGENFGDIENIKSAVILFKLERIHKIEKYVKGLIGPENYEIIIMLKPLIQEESYFRVVAKIFGRPKEYKLKRAIFGPPTDEELSFSGRILKGLSSQDVFDFFRLDRLKKLNDLLEKQKEAGQEEEIKKISKLVQASVDRQREKIFSSTSELFEKDNSLLDTGNILELDRQLKSLGKRLKVTEFDSFVEEGLAFGFFYFHCGEALKSNNFGILKSIYENWPLDKTTLKDVLIDLWGAGSVFEYYLNFHNKKYNRGTIKKSKFWKFLQEIGLENEVETRLRRKDEKI